VTYQGLALVAERQPLVRPSIYAALLDRLAVVNRHNYDSLNWIGSFDSINLSKVSDCQSFSEFKTLTGCWSFRHSIKCKWNIRERDSRLRVVLCYKDAIYKGVCMGTLWICFQYLKFNVLWIKLTCRAFLSYSLLFHHVWGRFETFSASYNVHCSTQNRTSVLQRPKYIFTWNERSLLKSWSAEARKTHFSVLPSLVHKSHCNGLKIICLLAQICLSRCCIMGIPNG